MPILLGKAYMPAAALVPLFCGAAAIKLISVPVGNMLDSRNLHWFRVLSELLAACIAVASVSYCVRRGDLFGVAISIFVAEACLALLYWGCAFVANRGLVPLHTLLAGLFALTCGLALSKLLSASPLLQTAIFVIIFLAVSLWLMTDARETLSKVRKRIELVISE